MYAFSLAALAALSHPPTQYVKVLIVWVHQFGEVQILGLLQAHSQLDSGMDVGSGNLVEWRHQGEQLVQATWVLLVTLSSLQLASFVIHEPADVVHRLCTAHTPAGVLVEG
jgi:hypothetical protein